MCIYKICEHQITEFIHTNICTHKIIVQICESQVNNEAFKTQGMRIKIIEKIRTNLMREGWDFVETSSNRLDYYVDVAVVAITGVASY